MVRPGGSPHHRLQPTPSSLRYASAYREAMRHRFARWAAMTGTERAASAAGRRTWPPDSACCCLVPLSSPTT
jgi:hypothetical protein